MSWTFEKVDIELLDNLNLNSHEKLIYILLRRFKNCKTGINVSNKYLMRRTGIKSKITLRKYLDNLSLYGLCARRQPEKKKANQYTFDKNEMQYFIRQQLGRKKSMSKKMKQIKAKNKYETAIKDKKVIAINKIRGSNNDLP